MGYKDKSHLYPSQGDIDAAKRRHGVSTEKVLKGINFHEVTDQICPDLDFTVENIPEHQKNISARLSHLENTLQRMWNKKQGKKEKKARKKIRERDKRVNGGLTFEEELFDALVFMLDAFDIGQMAGNGSAIHRARRMVKKGEKRGL